MSPSLVTGSSGGRPQGRRAPRLILKTINVIIEDEVNENETEATLWYDALDEPTGTNVHRNESITFPDANGGGQSGRQVNQSVSNLMTLADDDDVHQKLHQYLKQTQRPNHPLYHLMPMPSQLSGNYLNNNSSKRQGQEGAANKARIFWGEEVPQMGPVHAAQDNSKNDLKSDDVSYMTLKTNTGHLPFISIQPIKSGESRDDYSTASHTPSNQHLLSQHLLKLSSLRNYFQLLTTEDDGKLDEVNIGSINKALEQKVSLKSPYFLALVDPSMPRLTNCGYYYRMRYAVYVLLSASSNPSTKLVDHKSGGWRSKEQKPETPLSASDLVLHIGELHVYTIFPKGGPEKGKSNNRQKEGLQPKWCLATPGYLHYENVSFFANSSPLKTIAPLIEADIATLVLNFRQTLKLLNSVTVLKEVQLGQNRQQKLEKVSKKENFLQNTVTESCSLLLEQLKYPKSGASFSNTDRLSDAFVRNQADMFAHYYQAFFSHTAILASTRALVSPAPELRHFDVVAKKWSAALSPSAGTFLGKKPPPKLSAVTDKKEVDWSTVNDFIGKLHFLRNEAAKSSKHF